jgi:hypothetical protein
VIHRSNLSRVHRERGAGIVEFLIVAPLLILLGLGLVQTGFVFHSKSSLNFALQEGARVGSVKNGDVDAIGRGIREGLIPFMGGGRSDAERNQTRLRVIEEFNLGSAAGWIRVRQLSPTPQSFSDWAVDAYDEQGNAIREIPNASLAVLRCSQAPNGGASGTRASTACPSGGEPVGPTSQQTLADANLLKLNLTYGVKLSVPVVNRIVAGVLSMAAGCRANEQQRLGALNLGDTTVNAQPDNCAFYNAVDAQGRAAPRIPVNLSVTVRMQSPARFAGNGGWFARVNRDRDANTGGAQYGNGDMVAATQFEPVPVSQLNPMGVTLASDTMDGLGNNVLAFGSDTDWSARLTSGGGGPGNGGGEPELCTPDNEEQAPGSSDEGSSGILGSIWDAITDLASTAYDFVRGFWEGIKQQLGDIVSMVTDPLETARGIYELARAFIDDPVGTAQTIGEALGRDLQQLVYCGAYDKGRVLGNYISPAFMLKVAGKLARFGRAGLRRAVADTRRELDVECASFGAGTTIALGDGKASIESLTAGMRVLSRDTALFGDSMQRISETVTRTAPEFYLLRTERGELRLTGEHRLWVQGHGWAKTKDIELGAAVATATGDTLVLAKEHVTRPIDVFNFTVEKNANYFVGEEQIWSHNCDIKVWNPWGTRLPREGSGGNWASQRGNSAWQPQPGTDLYRATGGAPIPFNRGYPDFSQFAYRVNGQTANVDIPNMRGDSTDFTAARDEFRRRINDPNWEEPDGYTWHHHENCRSMILVPSPVNNNVPHTGGAANARAGTC